MSAETAEPKAVVVEPGQPTHPIVAALAASPPVFRVEDFGAIAGDATDDTAAIQAALDAAFTAGGGVVALGLGVYIVSGTGNPTDGALRINSNVTLDGEGMGQSVLRLADGYALPITGIIRTPINVAVHDMAVTDLTIDGNKANAPAHDVIGFFTGDQDLGQYSSDILVQRVEIHDVSGYGFDPHEQTYRIRLLDNVAHHNGKDGFALDYLVDSEASGNISYANARHGFNIVTETRRLIFNDNQAYDNGYSGVVVQRGTFDVPGPTDILIQGGVFHDNGAEGILIKMSDDVTVTGAEIYGNGTFGVNLYGSDGSHIVGNNIHDNSQRDPFAYDGVQIRAYDDTVYGHVYTSEGNEVSGNTITGAHGYGIHEHNDGSGSNTIAGNAISGNLREDVLVSSPMTTVSHDPVPPAGGGVFYAADFGATANDGTDDTAAINLAIQAAKAAGGGTVVLGGGVFLVSGNPQDKSDGAVQLLSGVTLDGAGMGVTVLKVRDGWSGDITGVVRTPFREVTINAGLSDLTLDGNRANTTGKIDGYYTGVAPGDPRQNADLTVTGVEIMNMSGYGFDPHEQTIRLTLENNVAHHNGLDGFVADYIIDGIYRNNLAYANDRHGFNITTTTTNLLMQDNIARDNGSTGITVQRGSEDIPWPSGVTIEGGAYYDNTREGIALRLADDVLITGAEIYGNGRAGIAVDGATNTVIDANSIHDNSQRRDQGYDEVRVDAFLDPTTGFLYPGLDTQITNNVFSYVDPGLHSAYAIRQMEDGSSGTLVSGNTFIGWPNGAISVPGVGPLPIIGTEASEQLDGSGGADDIRGLGGDDTILSGDGADSLDGGAGNDVASYAGGSTAVQVDLVAGIGTGGAAEGDLYVSIEAAWGSAAADILSGNALANALRGQNGNDTLSGAEGADTLDGGGGSDLLVGGIGDDVYNVNMAADQVVEAAGEGIDTVRATNSHTMAAFVENLELIGAAPNGTGNDLDNLISGNDGANVLKGLGGNDSLRGGLGADSLTGGAGDDVFVFAKGGIAGDLVADFAGAGVVGGDLLRFEGYGGGATLSFSGGVWTVTDGTDSESFTLSKVTVLSAGIDYVFV